MSRHPEAPEDELPEDAGSELDQELADALRAAWAPSSLDPDRQRLLLARALGQADAEAKDAEDLRLALERDDERHPAVQLASALRAAASPPELDARRAEQILERALASAGGAAGTSARRPPNLIYVVFGAASAALALAAAVALVVRSSQSLDSARGAAAPAFALSRSTAPLFHEKFSTEDSSERVGRIALVRERELRGNRFARWGVR